MLAHTRKATAESYVFADFHSYCTDQTASMGFIPKWGLFVRKQFEGGGLPKGGFFEGGD